MERINVRFTDIFNFEAKSDRIIIAVEVNPDGEVFVLTFGNGIKRVEADGNLTDFISGSFFESPLDFAIDSQGKFFVLDNAPLERRVNVFSATGIALPSENLGDGTYGEGVNQFRGPIGIAFDSSDNLYIADHYTGEIEVSDPSRIKIFHKVNGSYINNQFLEFTEIEGVPLNFPYRLAVNNEGLIFVSDLGSTGKGRVLVISIENGIPKLKDLLEGTADSLGSPGDIVVDAVGYIYIADFGDQINLTKILNATNDPSELINYFDIIKNGIRNEVFKIRVYSPQRKYQGFLLEEIDLPLDMALDSCGDLYVNNFELSGTKGTSYLGYVDMNAYLDFDLEIYQRISPADITAPIVSCVAPFAVTLDAIGKASITVDDVDNGSSDNCGIASRTLSKYDFTSADIGVVPVTLTVTDEAGLTATCTVNVTVEAPAEPEAPEATCNNFTVYLDANGSAVITAAQVYGGGDSSLHLAIDVSSFDCSDVGENPVVLTVTDPATGLSDTCTATITVVDNTAPVANCFAPFTVTLDANGQASITVDDINSNSSDNCTIADRALSRYNFTSADIGVVPVTLTVTDEAGLTATCTVNVTVEAPAEPEAPEATCNNFTVYLDANGAAVITAAQVYSGGDSSLDLAIDVSSFDCSDVGENPVVITVTDPATGLSDTCTATITVVDNTAPVANCVAPFTVILDANGQASITVDDINSNSSDNCTIADRALSRYNFTSEDIGVVPVTLTVTDEAGLTATCTVNVTVEAPAEPEAPEATCNNFTVYLDANGSAVITAAQVYSGGDSSLDLAIDVSSFDCSDVGENPVVLTFTDPATGLSDTCTATITVVDNTAPVANCFAPFTVTLDANGQASITVDDINSNSSDNCTIADRALSRYNFTSADIGVVPVTLTVTDEAGLTDTCTVDVTVEAPAGPEPPEATCNNFTVSLDSNGAAVITAAQVYSGGDSSLDLAIDVSSFDCSDIGGNPVILTVTDPATGLSSTCTATITVVDNTAPVANCVAPFTVTLDANGQASITVNDIENNSADNCTIADRTLSQYNFTSADIGVVPVTLTVTDEAGLTDTCTVDVTVEATQEPDPLTITCPADQTLDLDDNCELQIPDFTALAVTNDPDAVITQSPPEGTVVSENITITLTATLGAETASCNFDLILQADDNIDPTASCVSEFTLYLNEDGYGILSADILDDGSSDNCGSIVMNLSKTRFEDSDAGVNDVILTVTDAVGNTDTCETIVTVVPYEEGRGVNCGDKIVRLDENGEYTLVLEYSGNEDYIDYEVSKDYFTCNDIGNEVITVNYWGEHTGSCEMNVTVIDDIDPIADCIQEIELRLNSSGTASLAAEDLNLNSYDNCEIAEFSLSKYNFTTADIGNQQVTFTATDGSGNTGTCIVTVNVLPNEDVQPVECVDLHVIQIGANGSAILDPRDLFTGGSGTAQFTVSRDTFNCMDLGENTVVFNYSTPTEEGSCEITIIVEDPENRCEIPTEPGRDYVILYPNPSLGLVRLQTSPQLIIERIEVFDMRGRFLFEQTYENISIFDYRLDLRAYQSGVYSLLIHTNGREFLKRAIIKN